MKSSNWILRFAYLGSDSWRKPRAGNIVSICDVFWRLVFRLIAIAALLAIIIGTEGMILLPFVGGAVAMGVGALIFAFFTETTPGLRVRQTVGAAKAGVVAVKERFCPTFVVKE